MLTNTHVVLSHNYPLEASMVVVSFGTPGLRTRTSKFGQVNNQRNALKIDLCLEWSNTQVLIGLSELGFANDMSFHRCFINFSGVETSWDKWIKVW